MKKSRAGKGGDGTGQEKLPAAIPQIDILKGLAIIAVVLLHALPFSFFLLIGSPYHIWHAIPLFILIAGFTGAYAYKRYGSKTLKECYNPSLLIRRFSRLLVPFLLCWCIELCILFSLNQLPSNSVSLIFDLMRGGYGWGAYFVPVILQSVIFVPLLYLLAVRNPNRMVIIALFLTLLFDAVSIVLGWDPGTTSVLYFPYMFAGALGVWIAISAKTDKRWLILGGGISLVYLTLSCYTPLFSSFPNYSGYSGVLQAPAFMWTVILALAGLRYLPKKIESLPSRYIGELGKASWHIFLTQLIYYWTPAAFVYTWIAAPMDFGSVIIGDALVVILNLCICLPVGYSWYTLEKRISRALQK